MNDGIMNTWEVVSDYDESVHYVCAKKETAEYLRDWCQAICYDYWINVARSQGQPDDSCFGHAVVYSIQEGEVIL